MKKVLFMVFGFFLFLPLTNAFAYEGGLLHGKSLFVGNSISSGEVDTETLKMTDGLSNTYYEINTFTKNIVFKNFSPITIDSYQISASSEIKMTLYNSSYVELYSVYVNRNGVKHSIPPVSNVTYVSLKNQMDSKLRVYDFDVFGTVQPVILDPVTNLSETHDFQSVNLAWSNPTAIDFEGLIVKKDGAEETQLAKNKNSYTIGSLKPKTSYEFEVIAKYTDGGKSESKKIKVTTDDAPPVPVVPKNVADLKVKATHERVDLSWTLPIMEDFKHVNIYRDTVTKITLIDKLIGIEKAYAAETKIFETNGTYFNDLTVSPSTTYEYTITTTSTKLLESDGVTKQVTTENKPKPSIGGGGYEEDEETGDFTYSWTNPTTGQVKIMVGGVLYKTVPASDLKIVIPKASMKFNILGSPDVYLIPIDEDGTEGVPTKPPSSGGIGGGGVDIPFSPNDLLKSGMGLMLIVGPFLLLALAFLLVPKLRNMIVEAFNQRKGQPTTGGRRFNA